MHFLLQSGQVEQVLELGSLLDELNGPACFLIGRAHLCHGATFKAQTQFARTLSCFAMADESKELYQLAGVSVDEPNPEVTYLAKIMRLMEGLLPSKLFSLSEAHKPEQFRRVRHCHSCSVLLCVRLTLSLARCP